MEDLEDLSTPLPSNPVSTWLDGLPSAMPLLLTSAAVCAAEEAGAGTPHHHGDGNLKPCLVVGWHARLVGIGCGAVVQTYQTHHQT